jgi:hypothetical protein
VTCPGPLEKAFSSGNLSSRNIPVLLDQWKLSTYHFNRRSTTFPGTTLPLPSRKQRNFRIDREDLSRQLLALPLMASVGVEKAVDEYLHASNDFRGQLENLASTLDKGGPPSSDQISTATSKLDRLADKRHDLLMQMRDDLKVPTEYWSVAERATGLQAHAIRLCFGPPLNTHCTTLDGPARRCSISNQPG